MNHKRSKFLAVVALGMMLFSVEAIAGEPNNRKPSSANESARQSADKPYAYKKDELKNPTRYPAYRDEMKHRPTHANQYIDPGHSPVGYSSGGQSWWVGINFR